jgi:hypothetical protein
MGYESETAKRYHEHAEELRVIAHESDHEKTRKTLLSIARDYDRMASTLVEIDETNRSMKHPKPSGDG